MFINNSVEITKRNGILTFIVTLLLTWTASNGQNSDVNIGEILILQLTKSHFFSPTDALPDDDVRFIASEINHPDTPSWLQFLQRSHDQDGFLYGTPQRPDDTFSLEVVATNQRTFQTAYKIYNISVNPSQYDDSAKFHTVELWIRNYNPEEMIKGKLLSVLKKRLKRLWTDTDVLRVVNVVSMATVFGRMSVPDQPGQEVKDGVIVQIGAPLEFPESLLSVESLVEGGRCVGDGADLDVGRRFKPEYHIDWCNLQLIRPPDDNMLDTVPLVPEPSPWIPRSTGIAREDLCLEFILIVLIPLAIAVLLFIILSSIMFCKRRSKDRESHLNHETQLDRYNNIRGAMMNLRSMSNYRDGPPQFSPGNTPAPSACNTLSRHPGDLTQGPPPYKLPPQYGTAQRGASSSQLGVGETSTEADQLMERPRTPETLKVR